MDAVCGTDESLTVPYAVFIHRYLISNLIGIPGLHTTRRLHRSHEHALVIMPSSKTAMPACGRRQPRVYPSPTDGPGCFSVSPAHHGLSLARLQPSMAASSKSPATGESIRGLESWIKARALGKLFSRCRRVLVPVVAN
jgi:hypothetical protein